ncbi:MAG: hypothetical protein Q7T03_07725 [Deltaproteobacteria bacterium]|nr:hypothetical protein [Deltaproteobacteria bacterium]
MKLKFFFLYLLLFTSSVFAGGPYVSDLVGHTGSAAHWPYDIVGKTWVIHWKYDSGPLTSGGPVNIDNATAIRDWVRPLFDTWKNVTLDLPSGEHVSTVAIKFVEDGPIGYDITKENHETFTKTPKPGDPILPTVVIFDADGSITADYMQDKTKRNSIAGLGQPFVDSSGVLIQRGFIILNGRMIDGVYKADGNDDTNNGEFVQNPSASNQAEVKKRFQAVILHELGHLLNLDHAQVNLDIVMNCSLGSCDQPEAVPTLFPNLKVTDQFTPHRDDKVALSLLYPTQAFNSKFCRVTGEIVNKDGKGMQGVNVIASSTDDAVRDARAMVSGVYYAPETEDGHYVLAGLVPNQDYEISFEPLSKYYNDKPASGFQPLGPTSPVGFTPGVISAADGTQTVRCSQGGQTIAMPAFTVDITQPSTGESPPEGGDDGSAATGKGWWCSLNRNQTGNVYDALVWMGMMVFGIISLHRIKRKL